MIIKNDYSRQGSQLSFLKQIIVKIN